MIVLAIFVLKRLQVRESRAAKKPFREVGCLGDPCRIRCVSVFGAGRCGRLRAQNSDFS